MELWVVMIANILYLKFEVQILKDNFELITFYFELFINHKENYTKSQKKIK